LGIDAQNATDNTPLSGAKVKQNEEKTGLYNLGYSPLNTIMIENCLEDYPDFKTNEKQLSWPLKPPVRNGEFPDLEDSLLN
jgi:hypothetical protein